MLYVTYTRGSCDTANASAGSRKKRQHLRQDEKNEGRTKKKPSCVERLLLTAAGYVDFIRQFSSCTHTYIVVEAERCRVFPHLWQAGRNKHQLQAGSLLLRLLLLSLCPKCHFLVSNTLSCQVVVCHRQSQTQAQRQKAWLP